MMGDKPCPTTRSGANLWHNSAQLKEFQVAVSPYRAEYGAAATGFVNVVTRSGSDDLHGGAFYYNRNSGTGANDAISKANGLARPVDILQQFCGSLGGPVLPHRPW